MCHFLYIRLETLTPVDLESSDDDITEIQAEIAHLSTCCSDHVTRYYGSFVRGYRLWIVMEYLAGGSCLDLVRRSFLIPSPRLSYRQLSSRSA
jgi:serine/threonine protein kinase